MKTTVFLITRDPFSPWKKAGRMLAEAKAHGFGTVVCLDDRTSDEDREKIKPLTDLLIPWTSEGFCEKAYQFVGEVPTKFVLFLADDELPSPNLWNVALDPPAECRWGLPVIPVLGDRYDRQRIGFQERLSFTKGWQWVGGFEGHSNGARMAILEPNPGALIWHYLLEAPIAERMEKALRYQSLSQKAEDKAEAMKRLLYEDRESDLVPLTKTLKAFLPSPAN